MSQRRFGVLIACMTLVCCVFVAPPSFADSNARIVRLSYINGDAQINHNDKDEGFTHALLNMPVTSGMWLYTPVGSRAEVQFENGSTVRLVEDAQVQFEKLALANSGAKINLVNVDHGIVYLNFSKVDKKDQIQINLAGNVLRISKPARVRLEVNDKAIVIAALNGEAILEGPSNVEIKDGHTLFLNPQNPDQVKLGKGTDKYGTDMWDKNRDDELAAQAATHGNGMLNSTNSMYNAQYASLGSYGNFMSVPGYGNVWQPYGAGPGFDPFMNGMWGFYPGMGYMFISTSPWGWMPYRYGQWNYMSNLGWFWAPGATTSAFNLGPSYGAVPAGWHAPVQPAAGGTRNQYVVVGHPANVHPAILEGHAGLNTHPAPVAITPVRNLSLNQRGNSQNNAANRGMASSPNPRSTGRATPHSSGPAMHSSGPAMSGASHGSGSNGGVGGHPK